MRSFVFGLICSALISASVFCGCDVVIDPDSGAVTSEIGNYAQSYEDDRDGESQSNDRFAGNSSGSSKSEVPFNGSEVAKAIEVKGETCNDEDSGTYFLVLTLTNKSDSDCNLDLKVDFLNKKRVNLGSDSESFYSFQSGSTIAAVFECEEKFSRYEYNIEVADLTYYQCADRNLKSTYVTESGTTIITVTNNGEKPANSIEYLIVYYKDGDPVDYNDGFVVDENTELKPNKSANAKAKCGKDFDDIKLYVHGRAKP